MPEYVKYGDRIIRVEPGSRPVDVSGVGGLTVTDLSGMQKKRFDDWVNRLSAAFDNQSNAAKKYAES